jgi:hypothetical protein
MLTHGAMRGCGLTSLVVCINDEVHDIREKNVITRSEIWTTNIRSLRFQDIRKCVTIWRLILGYNSRRPRDLRGIIGHHHLSVASSKPFDHENLGLRLRTEGDKALCSREIILFSNPQMPPQASNGYDWM